MEYNNVVAPSTDAVIAKGNLFLYLYCVLYYSPNSFLNKYTMKVVMN